MHWRWWHQWKTRPPSSRRRTAPNTPAPRRPSAAHVGTDDLIGLCAGLSQRLAEPVKPQPLQARLPAEGQEQLLDPGLARAGAHAKAAAAALHLGLVAEPERKLALENVHRGAVPEGKLRFYLTKAPTEGELNRLTHTLAHRIGHYLERQGLLERGVENSYLAGDELESGPMAQLQSASITYRVAVGRQQGRKVFTLQTLPAIDDAFEAGTGKAAGFSLHACGRVRSCG
jgi:hypothetical protein